MYHNITVKYFKCTKVHFPEEPLQQQRSLKLQEELSKKESPFSIILFFFLTKKPTLGSFLQKNVAHPKKCSHEKNVTNPKKFSHEKNVTQPKIFFHEKNVTHPKNIFMKINVTRPKTFFYFLASRNDPAAGKYDSRCNHFSD